jgi:uncharacterized OsmC-like protein
VTRVLPGSRQALTVRPKIDGSLAAVVSASGFPDPASGRLGSARLPAQYRRCDGAFEGTYMPETIANALQRVRAVFARRPQAARHSDEPAVARWEQGLRVRCGDANGAHVATDMPRELGGEGDEVTPGWLMRAALASCLATRIAMEAAEREMLITRLEVVASSESDVRGLFGMSDDAGERILPAPRDVRLQVRVAATNVSAKVLETMVEDSYRCSPVSAALESAVPIELRIEVDSG